jgi:DNA modification methylase
VADVRLVLGDALAVLPTLEAGGVDAVVTSPPYDNMRQYRGVPPLDFPATLRELRRVVAPGGVVVWVVGDGTENGSESGTSFRQALAFMAAGFRLHDTMIYAKKNPVPKTLEQHRRYEQAFEFMFVFSLGRPKTFHPRREPCKLAGRVRTKRTHRRSGHDLITFNGEGRPIRETKLRGNIWYYSVKYVRAIGHPATFPLRLARDHILTWTEPGDTVLDPFSGSGTVAVACEQTGRNCIGVEISPEYHAIAQRRLAEARGPLFAEARP